MSSSMKMIMKPLLIMIMMMWMFMMMLKFKKKSNMKSMSPFECGFNPLTSKLPISIQFTLLVFVFLLFDIELSILICSIWSIKSMKKEWIFMMIMFIILMWISMLYEMAKKSMKWN